MPMILVDEWEEKHQHIPFSFKAFYEDIHTWIVNNEYGPPQDVGFPELMYLDIRRWNGREIWFLWRGKDNPKESPYFNYHIHVDVHGLGINEVETVLNNKKAKLQVGELFVNVKAFVETDWQGKWQKSSFMRFFHNTFYNRFFRPRLEEHKTILREKSKELHLWTKQWFEHYTFKKTRPLWQPPRGVFRSPDITTA